MPFPNMPPKPGVADDGASFHRGPFAKHVDEAAGEDDETKLLTEAADALGADPANADLVARIKDFLAKQGGEGIAAGGAPMPPPMG